MSKKQNEVETIDEKIEKYCKKICKCNIEEDGKIHCLNPYGCLYGVFPEDDFNWC